MEAETTLYVNGTVQTMAGDDPPAEALLTRGGEIVAVGSRRVVEDVTPRGARRVDLFGATVLPGFNDSHAHILWVGLALQQADVGPDAARTIGDIQAIVRRHAEQTPPGEWLQGRGYDQNSLAEGRHPTRIDLDEAVRDHPLLLGHTSGHVVTINSRALQLAGITGDTPDPAGGEIDRDEHGEPTGVLKESAMELAWQVVPLPTVEQGRSAVLQAMRLMASEGITSASDAATGHGPSIDDELAMYRGAMQSGSLAGRITLMPQVLYVTPPGTDTVVDRTRFDVGDDRDWLDIGPVKIFSDGALSTRTAAVREPYLGSDNLGILLWPVETLADMIGRVHAAGWHIATHALGDRAVEVVVDCYERALAAHPRRDHRHRIEHCMLLDDALAQRIKAAGIVPSLQPDIYRLGDGYITALGVERAEHSIPIRLFERHDITVAFSSDRPVIPGRPLEVLQSAMRRITPAGVVLGREHAVSAAAGVRNYTYGGAFATHTDHRKGVLQPGYLADFVVLSHDPLHVAPEDLLSIRVLRTVVGGTATYET